MNMLSTESDSPSKSGIALDVTSWNGQVALEGENNTFSIVVEESTSDDDFTGIRGGEC